MARLKAEESDIFFQLGDIEGAVKDQFFIPERKQCPGDDKGVLFPVAQGVFFDTLILFLFPLKHIAVDLLRLKRLVFRHEKFFRSVDHLFGRTAELFRFLAPIDVPFGIHAFDRHGNSEVFQYFGKEIVQVLGFHQRDGFFVYRADVGQHVAGFQPGKIDFVIKYLAAPVSFVPENEPTGFLGTYDGFELMIVGTDYLF